MLNIHTQKDFHASDFRPRAFNGYGNSQLQTTD